jgi:hypothetical protein
MAPGLPVCGRRPRQASCGRVSGLCLLLGLATCAALCLRSGTLSRRACRRPSARTSALCAPSAGMPQGSCRRSPGRAATWRPTSTARSWSGRSGSSSRSRHPLACPALRLRRGRPSGRGERRHRHPAEAQPLRLRGVWMGGTGISRLRLPGRLDHPAIGTDRPLCRIGRGSGHERPEKAGEHAGNHQASTRRLMPGATS